jgi:hypothetical protein
MVALGNAGLSGSQAGEHWTLTVTFDVQFNPGELGQNFVYGDRIDFYEHDSGLTFGDDHLGGLAEEQFTKPAGGGNTLARRAVRSFHEDTLDTEWGGEEIYAVIKVRNVTTSGAFVELRTPRLNISPG